ncbi:MAG: MmgE/PrpD family protein [Betaproteobacteria bacterium]|nr:MmgE/PrpD family protein [Betaproteobacteria bacterium]
MSPDITPLLAKWVARAPRIRRERVLAVAKSAIKDVVACMIAGAQDEATLRVARAARQWGRGSCSVVGQAATLSAPAAALVNGTAAHALDYDDNFHPMAGHATAVLAPAIFAAAEAQGASGHAVLDAYVVGLEVQARIGEGVNLVHYERGWHSTSTIGTFGAAAACARLLGLDAQGVCAALSLAFSMAGGSKLQFGTMAKPMHAGLAAQHGVMAADLAAAGVKGIAEPLEGAWGFRELFAGASSPGFGARPVRSPLAIERYGLKLKIHPCCASAHCAIDALLALRTEHGFSAAEVERVEVLVNRMSYDNLMYPAPRTELEARFSMHWCIAVALLQGRLGLADFSAEALGRKEIRAWLPRITMRHTAPGREHPLMDNGREPASVSALLKHGRRLERYAQHAKGTLQAPATAAELEAKFADCAGNRPALSAMLERFEKLPDLRGFMRALSRGAPPQRRPGVDPMLSGVK